MHYETSADFASSGATCNIWDGQMVMVRLFSMCKLLYVDQLTRILTGGRLHWG